MGEYLEIITLNIWHILCAILNLLILTWIVKKFLFDRVKAVLAQRQAEVDALYTDAQTARDTAEAERAEYEEKLGGAQAEAEEILRTATLRADRMSDQILAEASEKAAAKMRKADADIAQEKKKAVNEIKNEISGMSVEIAEKVVGREIKEEDHKKLIDSFIENL